MFKTIKLFETFADSFSAHKYWKLSGTTVEIIKVK